MLSVLAAVYGGAYMAAHPRRKKLGGHWFFFNVFVAGMISVLVARTVVLFMLAWEVMSVAAYGLVTFEHENEEVRRAGWTYLIATHLGAICILAAFLLLGNRAGSLDFDVFSQHRSLSAGWATIVFVLAFVGFGAKAGLVPVHIWLPEAHPAAPSHVSSLMSGVMVKTGIYGLLRIATFLGPPEALWGVCLAVVGIVTAIFGITLALWQRDLKRCLAYSSIENMGLIVLSLGVGAWGAASGEPTVSVLGYSAALLQVWNHALMKGLMFLAAGSVLHATGTKDLERLGGLMKRMPWTGSVMTLGAVAIAALPPLNGFVGKWLLYLGLANVGISRSDVLGVSALLALGVIAAVGGLAGLCFVRLVGIALLGTPRSEAASHAHESSWWMLGPMVLLSALCIGAAIVPQYMVPPVHSVVEQLTHRAVDDAEMWKSLTQQLSGVGAVNIGSWAFLLLFGGVLLLQIYRRTVARGPTWGCGYVAPTPRMQYTGRSFSELMASRLLPRPLRPSSKRTLPDCAFPASGSFSSSYPDPMTRALYEPFFARWANRFAALRILQQGTVHVYLVYIMAVVLLGLSWVALRSWLDLS
jgi:formate hydrogenlyase subunit 3/multisubunit Na+/H+ antiporter MnhD subunit